MPRYFIDVAANSQIVVDEEGTDLPDLEAGRRLALRALSEIARDYLQKGDNQTFMATLRDESGASPYCAKVTLTDRWDERCS
jgi:hypothetical protein